MGLNYSALPYLPAYDVFARPIDVLPAGGAAYRRRGIYGTRPIAILAEDSSSVSDQETILDIREAEFSVLPRQGDRIFIPRDGDVPAEGEFEVMDATRNGGGETTLVIRKFEAPRP